MYERNCQALEAAAEELLENIVDAGEHEIIYPDVAPWDPNKTYWMTDCYDLAVALGWDLDPEVDVRGGP